MLDGLERRVPQQVAAEQGARLDPVGFEEAGQIVAREPGVVAHGDHEAEPRRIRVWRRLRQDEPVLVLAQRLEQVGVVALARRDEAVKAGELRTADGRLHVGGLEVVAEVAVDVLVVVAVGQAAELLGEALAAGVVLAARAVAVAAPVAN